MSSTRKPATSRSPRRATPPSAAKVLAAGGVVWRPAAGAGSDPSDAGDVEIAVVHRPKYDDWSLPKGKVDPGEQLIVAAAREVTEETGFSAVCGRALGGQRYRVAAGEKYVRYWAMSDPAGTFVPQEEVDVLEWLAPEVAARKMTQSYDRALIRGFAAGPLRTTTVLVVRHGKAGGKRSWKADDLLRPLDAVGRASAQHLAAVVACYAPRRCLSAEPVRCLQTVQPAAAGLGLPVEVEPCLGQNSNAHDATEAVRRVRELVAEQQPVLLCSQGEVIPGLLAGLAEGGSVRMGKVNTRKGSLWALTFHGDRLIDADYLPDPGPVVPA